MSSSKILKSNNWDSWYVQLSFWELGSEKNEKVEQEPEKRVRKYHRKNMWLFDGTEEKHYEDKKRGFNYKRKFPQEARVHSAKENSKAKKKRMPNLASNLKKKKEKKKHLFWELLGKIPN